MCKKILLIALFSLQIISACLAGGEEKRPYDIPYPSDCHVVRLEVYVKQIGDTIKCFQTILFDKLNLEFFVWAFEKENGAAWARSVLDIGTGSGALGLTALAYGAEKAVGTDLDPLAVENARYNAKRLGLEKRFDVRQVNLKSPEVFSVIGEDERFDLIICDPPQGGMRHPSAKVSSIVMKEDFFSTDPDHGFVTSLVEGLDGHLTDNGRAWICLRYPDVKKKMLSLAEENGFNARVLISWSDDIDPKKEIPVGNNYRVPPATESVILYELTRK
ncbi:MAG: 50S ribosomal protein L11 methyltransferase [Candidatus Omnitrophica bacterium]|nr:50S ribosomal protein L11 methyltransferase [Candidatus Omnitrophota bacterium]